MAVITEKELPEKNRALWLKAKTAAELRNFGYAISLIQAVLKECPNFLEGRKLLRLSAVNQSDGKKSFLSGLSTTALRGGAVLKKDPLAAMELAEKTLESDPYNPGANNLLKDAAKAAGFPEIATFALETLVQGNPQDKKILHELGEHHIALGNAEKAQETYNKILQIDPADLVALKRGKDAAATLTMKTGGWETATSYRDLIKDKDEARQLEEKNRGFKDVATIDNQLAELSVQYESQPQNVDLVRRIALLVEQKAQQTSAPEDLEAVIQWYAYYNELGGGSDPAIARKLSDLQLQQLEKSIKSLEDWFSQGGDQHPDAELYRTQLEDLKKQRTDSILGEAKRRVDRNPTDLQLRFELGERLVEQGMFTEAIPELQRARQNPNARLRAMSMLGRCFTEKGMFDLAIGQLKSAASEMVAMDGSKKDTLYRLALLHEKMGNKDEYLTTLKEIYEADYGYLDVAKRVEGAYVG